ncbi:MAG TPA: TonB-dependent receptor [Rhizomicrobium sp.]
MNQIDTGRPSLRSALLLGAASATAIALSLPAFAQDQAPVETVVVTGSRIPQQGLYSSSPVTAIGQQEMKFEGTTNVENLLNNLPSVNPDQGGAVSNGSTGTATVNLRDLGANRTLVLIDGKRLMPGDPNSAGSDTSAADLNFIPAALVDHVEVMTGGASTVYGSDAMAGVVNFIMRKDFEGVEADGTFSTAEHVNNLDPNSPLGQAVAASAVPIDVPHGNIWDGSDVDGTLIMGANTADGKGNVTGYVGYRSISAVTQAARTFSSCSTGVSYSNSFHNFNCGGSSTNPGGRLVPEAAGNPYTNTSFEYTPTGFDNYSTPKYGYNFAPLNYLQRPDERFTGGFFGHYEINKAVDIFTSFMFMDDHTVAQLAPSGIFYGSELNVNCNNPFLSDPATDGQNANFPSSHDLLCGAGAVGPAIDPNTGLSGDGSTASNQAPFLMGRRTVEIGNRQQQLRHTDFRDVIGVKGDLGGGWSYEVFAQYGTVIYADDDINDVSLAKIQKALEVVDVGGVPTCQSVIDGSDLNCVPLNVFGYHTASSAALNYISDSGQRQGSTTEQIVGANVTGDLGEWGVKAPWAKSGVAMNVGVEYRREALDLRPDAAYISGELSGFGSITPVSGAYQVDEGYGEISVPLVQGMPFFEDLTANAGYRYSAYSDSAGNVSTYKYGLEWQMVDDFRLRGSYQHAVRAPNAVELFGVATQGLWGGADLCAGPVPGYTEAECARTFPNTPAGQAEAATDYGNIPQCSAAQCTALFSGNPNLKPEVANTYSIGGVFTPTFLDGFTATVDYYDIKINGLISVIPQAIVIGACAQAGDPVFCNLIQRGVGGQLQGTGNGSGQVISTTTNTGYLHTTGVDVEANYQTDMDDWGMGANGALAFNLIGTYTESLTSEPTDPSTLTEAHLPTTYNCAGLFGTTCLTPTPKWKHKFRATWSTPWDVDISFDWRFLSAVKLDLNSTNPNLNLECFAFGIPGSCGDGLDGHIAPYSYFDLAGTWNVRPGVQLGIGVNNIFDKDPPVLDTGNLGVSSPPGGNGNTFPQVYDSLGRVIFINATVKY